MLCRIILNQCMSTDVMFTPNYFLAVVFFVSGGGGGTSANVGQKVKKDKTKDDEEDKQKLRGYFLPSSLSASFPFYLWNPWCLFVKSNRIPPL